MPVVMGVAADCRPRLRREHREGRRPTSNATRRSSKPISESGAASHHQTSQLHDHTQNGSVAQAAFWRRAALVALPGNVATRGVAVSRNIQAAPR